MYGVVSNRDVTYRYVTYEEASYWYLYEDFPSDVYSFLICLGFPNTIYSFFTLLL
jgi:hypothetical protein